MAKADTVKDIKEKFGVDVPEALSQKKLDALLASEDKAAFDTLLGQLTDGDQSNDPPGLEDDVADETPTKKVRVNTASEKVSVGAAFIHPVSRTVIRDKLVSVPDDEWTQDYLANRFLTEK